MCNSSNCRHNDPLNDGIDDIFGPGLEVSAEDALAGVEMAKGMQVRGLVIEPCKKCRGSGRFVGYTGRVLGDCFACKGKGTVSYRSSLAEREKAAEYRANSAAKKAAATEQTAAAWTEANPEDAAWMRAKAAKFEFAGSMLNALNKFGYLTEKQHATVTRLRIADAERAAQWAAERAERDANKVEINVDKLAEAFATAKGNLLKWPKIRLAGFVFSPAGENSTNAGAIYVKAASVETTEFDYRGAVKRVEEGTYLGKVMGGRFTRSRDCSAELEQAIVAAVADPEGAAAAYGLQTGRCSCCGRELTNKDSVGLGIGPICREKFGW